MTVTELKSYLKLHWPEHREAKVNGSHCLSLCARYKYLNQIGGSGNWVFRQCWTDWYNEPYTNS